MAKFTYNIPSEFTDEDKWFKFFTKKDMGVIIVTGAITIFLYKIMGSLLEKPLIGLIVGGIIMIVSLSCSMIKLPDTLYLTGGGQTILILIIRKLVRRKNRVIYTKGYDDWEE